MGRKKYISIGDCEICRELEDRHEADQKEGWPEDDTFLPKAALRLTPSSARKHNRSSRFTLLQRCPICGAPYEYRFDYEYFPNGCEDSETLTRLTPADIRDKLTAVEYDRWMDRLKTDLDSPNRKTRDYARKCLDID